MEQYSHQATAIRPPTLRKITQLVQAVSGVNLGQGVCQLPTPEFLLEAANRAMQNGINRYTDPRGLLSLREALAKKLKHYNQIQADPRTEILVTCGSTGAFEAVCAALVNPGDQVVSFSPFYPYHDNSLRRFQADVHYVKLEGPNWSFDPAELERAITPKTKFVLVNTPGNPTGKVFSRQELEFIGNCCARHNVMVVTDEIYEYMLYEGRKHISPASLPALSKRTITIGGYSKTFAITGWRIGYLVVPDVALGEVMTALLDSIYVCPPAPLQQAVAETIDHFGDDFYLDLGKAYEKKRTLMHDALLEAGLRPQNPQGAYYMMADFGDRFPKMNSLEFVEWMIKEAKVGAVPASDFLREASEEKWLRFCYAVPDELLVRAGEQLAKLP